MSLFPQEAVLCQFFLLGKRSWIVGRTEDGGREMKGEQFCLLVTTESSKREPARWSSLSGNSSSALFAFITVIGRNDAQTLTLSPQETLCFPQSTEVSILTRSSPNLLNSGLPLCVGKQNKGELFLWGHSCGPSRSSRGRINTGSYHNYYYWTHRAAPLPGWHPYCGVCPSSWSSLFF